MNKHNERAELKTCPCCGGKVYIAELATRYSCYAIVHTKTATCSVSAQAATKNELKVIWNQRRHAIREA